MYSSPIINSQLKVTYYDIRNKTDWKWRFETASDALNRDLADFASLTGYSYGGFRQVIAGSVPSYSMLMDIVHYAHVNPYWLLSADGNPHEDILTDHRRVRGTSTEICGRIESVRRSYGMTYGEFSSYLGYSGSSASSGHTGSGSEMNGSPVSGVCRAGKAPDDTFLIRMANTCGIGIDWLISGDEEARDYPCNERMIAYLWQVRDVRRALRHLMYIAPSDAEIDDFREALESSEPVIEERRIYDDKEIDLNAMADRMKILRIQADCSQVVFAEMTDVSKSTVARWELAKTKPDKSTLRRISEALGIGSDWILYGDESRKYYPCDMKMIEFLKENTSLRQMIWDVMNRG